MKILRFLLSGFLLVTATTLGVAPVAKAATPPNITVAHWNYSNNCADQIYPSVSLESYTCGTLAHEWYDFYNSNALKAGATIIRANGYYKIQNPENGRNCAGVSGTWHTNTAQQNYVPGTSASVFPNSNSATINTAARGISPNQWYTYSSCSQNTTQELALFGQTWQSIITDSTNGVFSPLDVNYCIQNYGHTWLTTYSGLSISTYSY